MRAKDLTEEQFSDLEAAFTARMSAFYESMWEPERLNGLRHRLYEAERSVATYDPERSVGLSLSARKARVQGIREDLNQALDEVERRVGENQSEISSVLGERN